LIDGHSRFGGGHLRGIHFVVAEILLVESMLLEPE
jgi:hypothetical protein